MRALGVAVSWVETKRVTSFDLIPDCLADSPWALETPGFERGFGDTVMT